ncbi:hypothetical protein BKA57DRAFT_171335 [Linnemannia elongata]|nr:hypothetical protein BKA57DRAFT_171335 [Linnemannia elongata]
MLRRVKSEGELRSDLGREEDILFTGIRGIILVRRKPLFLLLLLLVLAVEQHFLLHHLLLLLLVSTTSSTTTPRTGTRYPRLKLSDLGLGLLIRSLVLVRLQDDLNLAVDSVECLAEHGLLGLLLDTLVFGFGFFDGLLAVGIVLLNLSLEGGLVGLDEGLQGSCVLLLGRGRVIASKVVVDERHCG